MKQWKVEYAIASISEDSYENGELGHIQKFELHEIKSGKLYGSLKELIEKVNREFGSKHKEDDFSYFEGNKYPELITSILVNEDSNAVEEKDYEYKSWVAGEINLYSAYIAIGLSIIEGERQATLEDFEAEGVSEI